MRVALATVVFAAPQTDRTTLQTRLKDPRALTLAEIDTVLDVVRDRYGGKPFHLVDDDRTFASDIMIERDGHVRFIQTIVGDRKFSDYTGRIARYCDGTVAAGEFVVDYRRSGDGWTTSARASGATDLLRPIFDILVGIKPVVDSGVTADGERGLSAVWNAGLTAPTKPPASGGGAAAARAFVLADPTINGVETLVIDPATLLPTRWEFSYRLPSASGTGLGDRVTVPYRFSFDDTLTLAPPAGAVTLPTCVDPALQGR